MEAEKARGEPEKGLLDLTKASLLEILNFLPWEERVAKEGVSPLFDEVCLESWGGIRDLDLLDHALRLLEQSRNKEGEAADEMTSQGYKEENVSGMLVEVWKKAYELQSIVLPMCGAFWSPQALEALAQLPSKPLKCLRLVGGDYKADGGKRCKFCEQDSHTDCPAAFVEALNQFLVGGTGEELGMLDLDFTEKLVPMEFPQELLAKTVGACPKLKTLRTRRLMLVADMEILRSLPRSIEDVDMNGLCFRGSRKRRKGAHQERMRPIPSLDLPNLRSLKVAAKGRIILNKISLDIGGGESFVKSLRVLDLSGHSFNIMPAVGLAHLQLEELYLNGTQIFLGCPWDSQFAVWSSGAPLTKSLKILCFGENGYAIPGTLLLLPKFSNLEQLDLKCTCWDERIELVQEILRGCTNLRALSIGGDEVHGIEDKDLKIIVDEGKKLERLDISTKFLNDRLTEEALDYLVHAVGSSENRHLTLYAGNAFSHLYDASDHMACSEKGVELILDSDVHPPMRYKGLF